MENEGKRRAPLLRRSAASSFCASPRRMKNVMRQRASSRQDVELFRKLMLQSREGIRGMWETANGLVEEVNGIDSQLVQLYTEQRALKKLAKELRRQGYVDNMRLATARGRPKGLVEHAAL